MSKNVTPIPEGFTTVTPHLIVKSAPAAIEFYKKAFGAKEKERHTSPADGKVVHAKIQIGNAVVMLADEFSEWNSLSPLSLKGTGVSIHLYVEDPDSVFNQAIKNGAKEKMPMSDTFWGERYGVVEDPFGHKWSISCRKKILTPEQIKQGAEEFFSQQAKFKSKS
jgi:uncharacterized glyoxalase superfamily protein PhnB